MKNRLFFIIASFTMMLISTAKINGQIIEINNSGQIKNVGNPIDNQDVTTKAYVDSMLLNFAVLSGSLHVQQILDMGFCPLKIILAGVPKDSLYGKNYAGGFIFYLDDQDTIPDIKGLVAAPSDQQEIAEWGCAGIEIEGADGSSIGTGAQNTLDIITGCTDSGIVAAICANLSLNGYDDWFLPSIDALYEMDLKLDPLEANLTFNRYWSSTEINNIKVWTHRMTDLNAFQTIKDEFNHVFRAIRAF